MTVPRKAPVTPPQETVAERELLRLRGVWVEPIVSLWFFIAVLVFAALVFGLFLGALLWMGD